MKHVIKMFSVLFKNGSSVKIFDNWYLYQSTRVNQIETRLNYFSTYSPASEVCFPANGIFDIPSSKNEIGRVCSQLRAQFVLAG